MDPSDPSGRPFVELAADGASAAVALRGAEPLSWRIAGRELLWHGDPAHWAERAPILFPVIGASAGGVVRIDGRRHPMPRHGFARGLPFRVVERGPDAVRLRLAEDAQTLRCYPFLFRLEIAVALAADRLSLIFTVANADERPLPYGLGFHPGFPWPFDGGAREDYRLVFEAPEDPRVPDVTAAGLLRAGDRRAPFQGRALPLAPALFAGGALVLRNVRSRSVRFEAPGGSAIVLENDGFPHLALWTKPGAPFLCIEPWTGEPDPDGFRGSLAERPSIRMLEPGAAASYAVRLRWTES
ncbi:MAG TPA: aldose 1-epimerase family protein [Beijerinckiaceae bacterium]|jgi:galactose mutarotase-like enzyme